MGDVRVNYMALRACDTYTYRQVGNYLILL